MTTLLLSGLAVTAARLRLLDRGRDPASEESPASLTVPGDTIPGTGSPVPAVVDSPSSWPPHWPPGQRSSLRCTCKALFAR